MEERFIGSFFLNLIMPITKLREKIAPIKIEQSNLNKFFPFLSEPTDDYLPTEIERRMALSKGDRYTLRMDRNGTVYIKETHCFTCGKRLVKSGRNPRIVIFDNGLGKQEFHLHRKRCKKCGEIKPDYSKIVPKYANYHENYKRRARQHYMEGLTPSQTKKVFKIDFGIEISESTIVNWVNEAAQPLREMLEETPVPSSGYWGYDEIHMKIKGKKKYAINLKEGRKNRKLWINGLVKDCTTNLGGLFRTRSFKHIKQQNCLTHIKWIVTKHVKAFTGLPKQSRKPIPKEWRWLQARFYKLIDSGTEAETLIWLEIVRSTVERQKREKIKELHTTLKQLESWFPKIISHQRNPSISRTNNVTEGFHKKYLYYRAFKKQMITICGAQRVLDYRVFGHNFKRFPEYIQQYETKRERWRASLRECKGDKILRGQGNHFKSIFRKLDNWYGKYMEVWNQYFRIL